MFVRLLLSLLWVLLGAVAARKYTPIGVSVSDASQENRNSNTSRVLWSVYDRIKNFNHVEYTYMSTFRNCLGSGCFNAPVKLGEGKSVLRVGILGLKASGSQSVLNILKKVSKEDPSQFEVISDTHVPPYGYGKNHGWSSIIRLARRVVQHSYSLVRPLMDSVAEADKSLFMDFQTRQIVRWQCRLSHVAAHTRMLTVYVDDLLGQPIVEIEKIISFIGLPVDRPSIVDHVLPFMKELHLELGLAYPDGLPVDAMSALSVDGKLAVADGRQLEEIDSQLIVVSLNALENELVLSSTLTAWPCKTFRELETRELDTDKIKLMPMQVKDVAPDCSAPHVKCTIRYDIAGG